MSTSINSQLHNDLTASLELALQKSSRARSATHIYSQAGHTYKGASVCSDSSVFDVTSEHAALVQVLQHNDFDIEKVITLTEEKTISPIAIKILKDYAARVGTSFTYAVYDFEGKPLLEEVDIATVLPEYVSPAPVLAHIRKLSYIEHNDSTSDTPDATALRTYATKGMEHHFLSDEEGSRYGCAIVTEDGSVHIGGAYGNPDKRLGLHAEMSTLVGAIMAGLTNITHVAVISSKYPDSPCPVCGHCRQLMSEIIPKIGGSPKIVSLASETDAYEEHTLDELLPHKWTSKKW